MKAIDLFLFIEEPPNTDEFQQLNFVLEYAGPLQQLQKTVDGMSLVTENHIPVKTAKWLETLLSVVTKLTKYPSQKYDSSVT